MGIGAIGHSVTVLVLILLSVLITLMPYCPNAILPQCLAKVLPSIDCPNAFIGYFCTAFKNQ